ncbi:IclR family transcriptional regulator [Salinivibrio sp. ML323]|uniref:uracil-DNA glycosylase family protein n=1 Tax=Salinivibrio sp. ML323 TaxID=1909474 RepID=UPI0009850B36|nr:uracil-DNA glycosylase family protein [Salinivibrio sp. ML323]OOE57664.1 IclR family transcriptional regulator [Salinivibrio sp. ML323]
MLFEDLDTALAAARACRLCQHWLPDGPRPVIQASANARVLIIGQAPGQRVHESGLPFNDPSGDRLREWLGVTREQFYQPDLFAIMPMGFCYPGKGQSGDLPPARICAPVWHQAIKAHLPHVAVTLLIGQYAQRYHLANKPKTLTETVKHWQKWAPHTFALPHPSPRNTLWLRRNPWFEEEVVPAIRYHVQQALYD